MFRKRVPAAALVAALVLFVASCSSGGKQSAPTTTGQSTTTVRSVPSAKTACTLGDLHRAGSVPMPRPVVLARSRIVKIYGARLDPPPVGVHPSVSARTAWNESRIKSPEGSYELVLASYTSAYPSRNRPPEFSQVVAWVVIGLHVPFTLPPALVNQTLLRRPCVFDTALDAFDAHTGNELVQTQVACRVSLGHDTTSVAVKLVKAGTASTTTGGYTVRFSIVRVPGPDETGEMGADVFGPTIGTTTNALASAGGGFRPSLVAAFRGSFATPKGMLSWVCGA